jgi:hypothetical protein
MGTRQCSKDSFNRASPAHHSLHDSHDVWRAVSGGILFRPVCRIEEIEEVLILFQATAEELS